MERVDPPAPGQPVSPASAAPEPKQRRRTTGQYLMLLPFGVILVIGVIGPYILPYSATRVSGPSSTSPNHTHWFGTDSAGLDVFSRTIAATRENLLIAVFVAVLATTAGVVLGLVVGMNESTRGPLGWLARGVARVVDLIEAVPAILMGLVAVSFYGATTLVLILVLSLILCPIQIRLVRTEVLRVRSEAYLDAARMAGQSQFELTVRHVLPNSSWAALGNSSVIFAYSIVVTAALGFIGVGLPPPAAEWGSMLARGATDALVGRWWSAAFPTVALALTVAAVSLAAPVIFERKGVTD